MKKNKILLFAFLIMSIGIEGCSTLEVETSESEEDLICGVSDPINQLSWLKGQLKKLEDIPESGIILYRYNGKDVIEIQSSLMSSTNQSQYYCDGTKLQFEAEETYENDYKDFLSRRDMIKILYGVDLWQL